MNRFSRIGLVASMIIVAGAACGADDDAATPTPSGNTGSPASPDGADVSIDGNAYDPEEVTVARGTEVRWLNDDGATHTVTADDGAFGSANLAEGDEFTFTFDEVGEFTYTCEIHPFMAGKVTVE